MIKFNAELTVKKVENKSIRKRDGGTFDFTEATLEQAGKRPTIIVARVDDAIVADIRQGLKADMELGVTSFTTQDGRTFNNFLLLNVSVKQPIEPLETAMIPDSYDGDDIPF